MALQGSAVRAAPANAPRDLAKAANNPAAPLTQIELRNITGFDIADTSGAGNLLQFNSALPFKPTRLLPVPTILKLTLPLVTLPSPYGQTALGDFQLFGMAVFEHKWGSFALGASGVLPTATVHGFGQQTWQVGPAAAIIVTAVDGLVFGGVFQNPISVNSSSHRRKSNALTFAPTLTYNLPSGWFIGYSDFNWTFDWESEGAATIPLGAQVGKVFNIGKQPFSASVEAGYNVVRPANAPSPGWMIGLELTALFPTF